jgi:hypothetical protein
VARELDLIKRQSALGAPEALDSGSGERAAVVFRVVGDVEFSGGVSERVSWLVNLHGWEMCGLRDGILTLEDPAAHSRSNSE